MEPDVIANLIEAAERYYDAHYDEAGAEIQFRLLEKDAAPLMTILAAENGWRSQQGETLRALGALLRAVNEYREANKPIDE